MTAPVLPKTLGEGEAFFSKDHNASSQTQDLYSLIVQLMKSSNHVHGRNAGTITTGVKGAVVATFDGVLGLASMRAADNGSAGSTVVTIKKTPNGSTTPATVSTLTLGNADVNGTIVSSDLSSLSAAAFVAGDLIELDVTTAPTAGSDLNVSVQMRPFSLGK